MKKTVENILWIVAFLLIEITWMSGLFVDTTGDSGLYAAIVRQMVESGNWLNLKINDAPYLQKPHLFFWLAGLGVKLFGYTNFAFKLFPFLYGLTGIYFTYQLGRQLFSEKAGRFAAMVAGTSQIFYLYFFDMHTDLVLQTGVVLALWQLAAYFQSGKTLNFILSFLGIGLAMLSKGPIGAVLPFLTALIYLLVKRDFRNLFHPKWVLGILIVVVLISPTLLHLYKNFGLEGLKFYFISNNIGRITGKVAGSSTDYLFYIHTFLWAFLPWTPVVVFSLVKIIRDLKVLNHRYFVTGLLGSLIILILILSVAKGKAPNYFLITVPVFSVFGGLWLSNQEKLLPDKQKGFLYLHQIFAGLYVLFLAFALWFLGGRSVFLPMIIVAVSGLCLFFIFKAQENIFLRLILFMVFISAGLNLFVNVKVYPELAEYQGGRQVLRIFETQKQPGDKLYNFEPEDYNLFFYSKEQVSNINKWDQLYNVADEKGAWIYIDEVKMKDILSMNFKIDTVYQIRQRGLNQVTLKFLNPETREETLITNYLVVTGGN